MSASPTSRSPDLSRLAAEGYDLALRGGTLLVRGLPYVSAPDVVSEGTLVVPLRLRGDATMPPERHAVWWIGRTPCSADGAELVSLVADVVHGRVHDRIEPTHQLCNALPDREFADYHELVTTYAALLGAHAEALRPGVTSRFGSPSLKLRTAATPPPAPPAWTGGRRGPVAAETFRYVDTASSRAGLDGLNARIAATTVGIVGLGGTGSHVLDLIAKSPVAGIRLYDGDVFEQHNAFRSPGAASPADVGAGRMKVHHFAAIYSAMRRGVVAHPVRIGAANAALLDDLDFCFVCIDDSAAKAPILDRLSAGSIPWIDVGMGLHATRDGLIGALRTTVGLPGSYEVARTRVPCGPRTRDDYSTNVQTGDLNALNAALAVVEWKRTRGFYASAGTRTNSILLVDGGDVHAERGT